MNKPKILVVGCMNMDLFVRDCNALPGYGQSIISGDYGYSTGGKGSNQALAAAKLGGDVTMVGRVGTDTNGDQVLQALRSAGVNVDWVVRDEEAKTGLALMLVNSDGRYVCYVSIGANFRLTVEDVRRALDAEHYDMLVMQLEVPLEIVFASLEMAKERGIPVFLDAGPAMQLPMERIQGLYILSPNEAETEALTGISVETEEGAVRAARWLYEQAAPKYVILKLGSRGALLYDGGEMKFIPCSRWTRWIPPLPETPSAHVWRFSCAGACPWRRPSSPLTPRRASASPVREPRLRCPMRRKWRPF